MKKITNKIVIIVIGIVILTQNACKKDLNLVPTNQPTDATFWTSPDQFKSAASLFYGYLPTFDYGASYLQPYNLEADYNSDFSGGISAYSESSFTPPLTNAVYTNSYGQLRAINNLLEKAQTYKGDAAGIKQYVAEAHFFRAFVYFRLLFYFGGVPLITSTLTPASPALQAPRANRDDLVNFIIAELDAASANLLTEDKIAAADKGRISKTAALAFEGRVTLFEGTWNKFRNNAARANEMLGKSVDESNQVMSSGQYQLFAPENGIAMGDSTYKYLFILENQKSNPGGYTKANNKEFIILNRYDYTLRPNGALITHAGVGTPTSKLANLFLCSDGLPIDKSPLFQGYATKSSEFKNRDSRMKNLFRIPGNLYYDNSPNPRFALDGTTTNNAGIAFDPVPTTTNTGYFNYKYRTERGIPDRSEGYDYPVLRYAEVLLNYAEAKFELDGQISDADLNLSLNKIRTSQRTGLPALTNSFVVGNGLDMRTEIRRERSVELAWEGLRIFDLLRWKTAETEMKTSLLGINYSGTAYASDSRWTPQAVLGTENGFLVIESSSKRFFSDKNYLLPIPTQEIAANPNLKQNPGW
ncbi:RagB/SusD family nutrient uptake outer membrane protein [Mucilaginibacter sp. SJ]|uniref:RagB/SusD family nutrient uptake outer membrane protein n=1 Tax=Mucilaginibacter sp. SJ TaxID=3029053 RepID=UPI0023AA0403|nr:RagB/SusD family nutrient uptake outer membrane protein [Mucilaginibacter sp. SJ]WEA00605.1 RagB/SusD family nutrient uptake outer membrane protein [Mucilaginibacter sp. SJ]